jgi:hypothetical protein
VPQGECQAECQVECPGECQVVPVRLLEELMISTDLGISLINISQKDYIQQI